MARLIEGTEPETHQFRLGRRREGDRATGVHDHGPDAEVSGRQRADPVPDRRVRDLVHAADRPLFRPAVRHRRPDRHLAAVRDHERRSSAASRSSRVRLDSPGLSRLCPRPRAGSASRPASPTPAATWARRGSLPDRADPPGLARCWPITGSPTSSSVIFDTHGESIGRGAHPGQLHRPLPLLRHAGKPPPVHRGRHPFPAGDQLPGR